jgi:cell division protease FtsH
MNDLKTKLFGFNPFARIKEKTRVSYRNFNRPSYWFIAGFVSLVAYFTISNYFEPVNSQLDVIYQSNKENKKITPYLYANTPYSRNYLFEIENKSYLVVLFLKDLDVTSKELKTKTKLELPNTEITYRQKLKLNRYADFLLYFAFLCFFMGIRKLILNQSDRRSDVVKEQVKTKFKEIAGIDEIKGELQEVVNHFKNSDKLKAFGGEVLRGVLMYGPPGTGKTLMAKAVAGETNSHFIAASGSQFVEMYVGVGAQRVRKICDEARRNTPCVIFIDEIDAFAKKRGSRDSHSEYDQTINEMLAQMDGMKDNTGILVIAATNRIESIDDALTRPGRFDRKIKVDLPSVNGRKAILDLYVAKNKFMSESVDTLQLAKMTTYFSGADLSNLVKEAIILAFKKIENGIRNARSIEMEDFTEAKDKIQLGTIRDLNLSVKDKTETAYHEMGHALISYKKKVGEVNQITIVPRGNALGLTHTTPEEKYSYSREDLENQIMMLLGGKCAEMIMFNKSSTGVSNDLERATSIARKIVCDFGMGDHGPINLNYGSQEYHMLSDQTKYQLDKEVMSVLKASEKETSKILEEHKELLVALSERLIEKETMFFPEFKSMIDGFQLKKD